MNYKKLTLSISIITAMIIPTLSHAGDHYTYRSPLLGLHGGDLSYTDADDDSDSGDSGGSDLEDDVDSEIPALGGLSLSGLYYSNTNHNCGYELYVDLGDVPFDTLEYSSTNDDPNFFYFGGMMGAVELDVSNLSDTSIMLDSSMYFPYPSDYHITVRPSVEGAVGIEQTFNVPRRLPPIDIGYEEGSLYFYTENITDPDGDYVDSSRGVVGNDEIDAFAQNGAAHFDTDNGIIMKQETYKNADGNTVVYTEYDTTYERICFEEPH